MAVTVYTKPNCMPCQATKRHLKKLGIPFAEVNLADTPEAADTVRALGYIGAPVVTVDLDDGQDHWYGYKPDTIDALAYLAAAGQ
ncbi:glutaredoxin domain-containing protein [Rhodococcus sp. NPDC055112]